MDGWMDGWMESGLVWPGLDYWLLSTLGIMGDIIAGVRAR